MSRRTSPCLWTPISPSGLVPCNRYKHACCAHGDSVYLLGGRESALLRDFWKYNVARNEWVELDCSGDESPDELEGHSMVAHQGCLYVFGGMIDSAYSERKTPLWLYDTGKDRWGQLQGRCWGLQNPEPVNRKGHSAVVFQSAMYIYGGYIDMKGSSQDFWKFDFDAREWSALKPAAGRARPGPRHGHSAVVHLDSMYLFGGLMGLREQRDFWRWSFSNHTWCTIKSHCGPPRLVGHSVGVFRDTMLLFGGGESQGSPNSALWKFSFASRSWEKLSALPGMPPPCKVHHCSTGLGPGFEPSSCAFAAGDEGPFGALERSSSWPFRMRRSSAPISRPDCPAGAMELDTFRTVGDVDCLEKQSNCQKRSAPCGSRAPGEEVSGSHRDSKEPGAKEESIVHHLPDLLLVTGGKPLGGQAGISLWMMTLTDL
ncbi:leucine-zipper-like transcriptional regulator 1 homolog [Scleropages formosus]|uniref:leucine-zipper-like transcriptional regulator 1 homolog n=1 Tax=Scleropages formosus TaxID=113540 RepID=UPI0010FAA05B|nr:leucine-zipper-like transcriptional regulator 1 homolog [Scleropages formosus]XP_018597240.2 leucine-zipper-like transcriptional regulator 1 homolog [Scleropages formosus]XP_018597249.2 leucine-zipper-like transcriptional regulator 1 homolog [Scleropages formosus]